MAGRQKVNYSQPLTDLFRIIDMTAVGQMWTSPVVPFQHLILLNSYWSVAISSLSDRKDREQ